MYLAKGSSEWTITSRLFKGGDWYRIFLWPLLLQLAMLSECSSPFWGWLWEVQQRSALYFFLIWMEMLHFLLFLSYVENKRIYRTSHSLDFLLHELNIFTVSLIVFLRELHFSKNIFFLFFVMTAHLKSYILDIFLLKFRQLANTISFSLQYIRLFSVSVKDHQVLNICRV